MLSSFKMVEESQREPFAYAGRLVSSGLRFRSASTCDFQKCLDMSRYASPPTRTVNQQSVDNASVTRFLVRTDQEIMELAHKKGACRVPDVQLSYGWAQSPGTGDNCLVQCDRASGLHRLSTRSAEDRTQEKSKQ